MREVGWLIERRPRVGEPRYLIVLGGGADDPHFCRGVFTWGADHHVALRFARREDAVLFIGALRDLSEALPHSATIPGLRSGDEAPQVLEHVWCEGQPGKED
jgi:hypothetical protein